jgi:putative sigma-54 modulation protein
MLEKLDVSGIHTTLDPSLRKYVQKKIGSLDKYIPRNARSTARMEVFLKESKAKDKNTSICEVNVYLPHSTINIKECAINMYSAIDIVEEKIKVQLKKYKDRHASGKARAKLQAKLANKSVQTEETA